MSVKTVRVEDILDWGLCYDEADIMRLAGKRKRFTATQAVRHLAGKIPNEDILWLVLRPELIDDRTLHSLACDFAEHALDCERKSGREPHHDSWRAIEVKRLWLDGKATDQQLLAAREAAVEVATAEVETAAEAAETAAWAASARAAAARAAAAVKAATAAAAAEAAWAASARAAAAVKAARLASGGGPVAEREWQIKRVVMALSGDAE